MNIHSLLLFQFPFFDSSVQLLWIVTLVLAALALLLFFASIIARTRHWSYEQLVKTYQNKHYPLILEYLGGERSEEEIEKQFRGQGIEFSVFEDIIFEMLENLEGEDADKLRQLLFLSPIFNYHLEQLNSSDNIECIKACNYFSYVRLINYKVIKKLEALLSSENKMVVFSAASALMASKEVEIREKALKEVAGNNHYSRMALLEMVYNFHKSEEDQMKAEGEVFKRLIDNENVAHKNVAILIEGASEIGYQDLLPFLVSKLKSPNSRWKHPATLRALIKAQGTYYNFEAFQLIEKFITHSDSEVRKSVAYALSHFGNEESLEGLYKLLYDRVYAVKLAAARGLYENGNKGEAWLQAAYDEEDLNIRSIVNTL